MFLVELVLQGVRGFQELARLRFQSRFNIVVAGNESGKTTAMDSMKCLLFPGNRPGRFETLVSRYSPESSRAALVMCSDDGAYYRIIQDLSKHAVNLSKYNTASKDFSLLHKDWGSAAKFMEEMTAGISEADLARVYFFEREQTGASLQASMPAPSVAGPPASFSKPAAASGNKAEANQEKLAELREKLRKAEEAADADYKYNAAKIALDDFEKKISSLDESEQKKNEMEATVESLKECEGMPEDLSELIKVFDQSQRQRMVDLDDRRERLEGLKAQLDEHPQALLIKDMLFISGAALGLISILAGLFVLTDELAFLFPLGVLLSLILMAGAWYNSLRKNVQRTKISGEIAEFEIELKELEERVPPEGATVIACMKKAGASSTDELQEKVINYRYFRSLLDDIEGEQRRILGDRDPVTLRQQHEQLKLEVVELEKTLHNAAEHTADTYSLRQDIERLNSQMSGAAADGSWDFGAEPRELPVDFTAPAVNYSGAGFLGELGIASRIGAVEMETLVPAVEAAAQRNLAAVTGGKYVRIEAGNENGPILHAKDDSVVDYAELSHGTRSLIYFCLRTGLIEVLAGKRRFPFILDDPLTNLDPARQKAACHILRILGTKTQVILFTSNPALKAEGDAAAELK